MRRSLLLLAVLVTAASCTTVRRARSYPTAREITAADWYQPQEAVSGRSGATLPTSAPEEAVDADTATRVIAWAAERGSTGLVVLRDGEIALEWYADGFDASSRINGMSMTKTLVALAVGTAIADGSIASVDDPVSKYVPELAGDKREHITIRHLLEMSSGLRNDDEARLGSDLVKMYLGTHVTEAVLEIPAEKMPGNTFDYNNANSQLLALALERATGRRWADLLSERIWRPIGASEAAVWLDRRNGDAKAFCCLLAAPRDWARVGQLMLDEGRVGATQVVPRDYVVRMTLPSPNNPDYGWQIWRAENGPGSTISKQRTEPIADARAFWLSGRGEQRVYVLPEERLVIVRVGEAPSSWDDAYLPNTLHRAFASREAP